MDANRRAELIRAAAHTPDGGSPSPTRKKLWKDLVFNDLVQSHLDGISTDPIPRKLRWGRDKAKAVSLEIRVAKERKKAKQRKKVAKVKRRRGK